MDVDSVGRPLDDLSSDENLSMSDTSSSSSGGDAFSSITRHGIIYSCVICGETIGDYCRRGDKPSSPWLGEFRAVLPKNLPKSDKIILTGVGYVSPYAPTDGLSAPIDPAARWDDENLDATLSLTPMENIMGDRGHRTFVVHDACWILLGKAYHPDSAPVSKFWAACVDMPHKGERHPLGYWVVWLKWGHDYGGMLRTVSETAPSHPGITGPHKWPRQFSPDRVSSLDPVAIPSISQLMPTLSRRVDPFPCAKASTPLLSFPSMEPMAVLKSPTAKAKARTSLPDPYTEIDSDDADSDSDSDSSTDSFVTACETPILGRSHTGRDKPDPFLRFPPELRFLVAFHLTTPCIKLLRRASRAFWFLFHDSQFWASRFQDHRRERSWLFETTALGTSLPSPAPDERASTSMSLSGTGEGSGEARRGSSGQPNWDWRDLYWCTGGNRVPTAWKNRRRVWKLVRGLKGLIGLRLAAGPRPPSWVRNEIKSGRWREMNAFFESDSPLREQRSLVVVPGRLNRLEFLFVGLGRGKYLAGLKLIGRDGRCVEAGYQTSNDGDPPCEGFVARYGFNVPRRKIRGFVLAVDQTGIRALSCILDGGQATETVGQWELDDHVPVTWRLVCHSPTEVLRVGVGPGWRLNDLAVCETSSFPRAAVEPDSLFSHALWSPSRPGLTSCPVIARFPDRTKLMAHNYPLFSVYFGGPKGKYMRNITKMAVSFTKWGIDRFEFHYNVPVLPRWSRAGKSTSRDADVGEFTIDGPGGEFINAIEIRTHFEPKWADDDGSLNALKVFTNRGRSFVWNMVEWEVDPDERTIRRTSEARSLLKPAPGTTVTGIFFSETSGFLVPLGLLCCKVKDKTLEAGETEPVGPVGDALASLTIKLEAVKMAQSRGSQEPTEN